MRLILFESFRTGDVLIDVVLMVSLSTARNTRHTISPEETLKRIEMLKKRRRYLSSGNLLDSDTADGADGDAETQTDASEMYVRTEEKVLTQIRRMKGEEETFVDVRTGGSLMRSGAYGTSLDYNTIELVVKGRESATCVRDITTKSISGRLKTENVQ